MEKKAPTEIEQLLAVDHGNESIAARVLNDFSPDVLGTLNEAAVMFRNFMKTLGEGRDRRLAEGEYRKERATIEAHRLGREMSLAELGAIRDDPSHPAHLAWAGFLAREVRPMITLLAGRCYDWAVTDLLRFRLTAAKGACRVEAEAVALLCVVHADPIVGWHWLTMKSDEGQAFHLKHRDAIKEQLRRFDLFDTYETSSAEAQHPRYASIARGLHIDFDFDRRVHTMDLVFQEFDPERPVAFILEACSLAAVQIRVFRALVKGLPEADDKVLIDGRLPIFQARVGALVELLRKRYPDDFAGWEKGAAEQDAARSAAARTRSVRNSTARMPR